MTGLLVRHFQPMEDRKQFLRLIQKGWSHEPLSRDAERWNSKNSQKSLPSLLSKPPKPPFDSFDSREGMRIYEKNTPPDINEHFPAWCSQSCSCLEELGLPDGRVLGCMQEYPAGEQEWKRLCSIKSCPMLLKAIAWFGFKSIALLKFFAAPSKSPESIKM